MMKIMPPPMHIEQPPISYFLCLTVILISLVNPLHANAEENLWQVVAEDEAREITALNKRFLVQELFFAKRHQVVTVDHSKLDSREDLFLSLFDHGSFTLKNTDVQKDTGYLRWSGSLSLGDTFSLENVQDVLTGKILPSEFVAAVLKRIEEVTLTRGTWDVSETNGLLALTPLWERKIDGTPKDKSTIYTTTGRFRVFPLQAEFALEPLPNTPKYHLLTEVDPTKSFANTDSAPDPRTEEGARKIAMQKAYRKHLEENEVVVAAADGAAKTLEAITWLKTQGVRRVDEKTSPALYQMLQESGYDPETLQLTKDVVMEDLQ